jgi:hypothetical protein
MYFNATNTDYVIHQYTNIIQYRKQQHTFQCRLFLITVIIRMCNEELCDSCWSRVGNGRCVVTLVATKLPDENSVFIFQNMKAL